MDNTDSHHLTRKQLLELALSDLKSEQGVVSASADVYTHALTLVRSQRTACSTHAVNAPYHAPVA